jgi:hypothetical protein
VPVAAGELNTRLAPVISTWLDKVVSVKNSRRPPSAAGAISGPAGRMLNQRTVSEPSVAMITTAPDTLALVPILRKGLMDTSNSVVEGSLCICRSATMALSVVILDGSKSWELCCHYPREWRCLVRP